MRSREKNNKSQTIRIKVSFDFVIDNEKLAKIDPNNHFLSEVKENRKEVINRCINQLNGDIEEYFNQSVFERTENLRVYEVKE